MSALDERREVDLTTNASLDQRDDQVSCIVACRLELSSPGELETVVEEMKRHECKNPECQQDFRGERSGISLEKVEQALIAINGESTVTRPLKPLMQIVQRCGKRDAVNDLPAEEGLGCSRSKIDVCCEEAANELGGLTMRTRDSIMSQRKLASGPLKGCNAERCLKSSTRGVHRHDRQGKSHRHIRQRRQKLRNIFNDAEKIEEFFAAYDKVEREEGKKFTDRYNFDVVNDLPLNGRFEWVVA